MTVHYKIAFKDQRPPIFCDNFEVRDENSMLLNKCRVKDSIFYSLYYYDCYTNTIIEQNQYSLSVFSYNLPSVIYYKEIETVLIIDKNDISSIESVKDVKELNLLTHTKAKEKADELQSQSKNHAEDAQKKYLEEKEKQIQAKKNKKNIFQKILSAFVYLMIRPVKYSK